MALFHSSASPGIVVNEIDLTGVVPNVQTTTGAYVGNFRWGPAEVVTLVDNEATLVSKFASPDDDNSIDFHSAAYFLRYSNSLQVVREVVPGAVNSFDSESAFSYDSGSVTGIRTGNFGQTVKNDDDWDTQISARDSDRHSFLGRYPGALGNSLSVHTCPALSSVDSSNTVFNAWTYKSSFDGSPRTSDHATGKSATLDEMHVAVVDRLGEFTGTAGAVLETYPFVSLALGAKNTDGSSNYIKDVINN